MSEKLSHEEFVKKAIVSLRKEGYKYHPDLVLLGFLFTSSMLI